MNTPAPGWTLEARSGTAEELHALPEPSAPDRVARILSVSAPAVVLGSTQSEDTVDRDRARRAGVAVARRRSGGGAVLLVPGEHVWVDLFIAADDELWDHDVVTAAGWVGDAWCGALAALGATDLTVHRAGLVDRSWSRLVCFAGLGPGEVSSGDQKLVGVSQRRTRDRLRVQTSVHRRWDPVRTLDVLALDPADRRRAERALADRVASFDADPGAIVDALLAHLPV